MLSIVVYLANRKQPQPVYGSGTLFYESGGPHRNTNNKYVA